MLIESKNIDKKKESVEKNSKNIDDDQLDSQNDSVVVKEEEVPADINNKEDDDAADSSSQSEEDTTSSPKEVAILNRSVNDQSNFNKVPPNDLDAEKALLCCILMDEDYKYRMPNIGITSDHFYNKANSIIYEGITELENESKNVDLITLKDQLVKMAKLNEAGGVVYLAEIIGTLSTSANILYYAEIIESKFILRSLISVNTESIETAYQEIEEADQLLDRVSSELFTLAEKKSRNIPKKLGELLIDTYAVIKEFSDRGDNISGIATGYEDLDNITLGWQDNALMVLAARPGMGKTQLALNFAINAAKSEKKSKVAFFSLEMGNKELVMRLLSMEGNISLSKLKSGKLSDDDWGRLARAMNKMSQYDIYIDDSSSLNILELRTKVRRLKKDKGIDILFVDYIGLMDTDSNVDRHEGIAKISRSLKALAKDLEIPVFALSQLNREVEKRTDKRPQLSDLRESGAIEQDADIVLFISKPPQSKEDADNNVNDSNRDIIIAKHRSGPTGNIQLHFNTNSLKFETIDHYH